MANIVYRNNNGTFTITNAITGTEPRALVYKSLTNTTRLLLSPIPHNNTCSLRVGTTKTYHSGTLQTYTTVENTHTSGYILDNNYSLTTTTYTEKLNVITNTTFETTTNAYNLVYSSEATANTITNVSCSGTTTSYNNFTAYLTQSSVTMQNITGSYMRFDYVTKVTRKFSFSACVRHHSATTLTKLFRSIITPTSATISPSATSVVCGLSASYMVSDKIRADYNSNTVTRSQVPVYNHAGTMTIADGISHSMNGYVNTTTNISSQFLNVTSTTMYGSTIPFIDRITMNHYTTVGSSYTTDYMTETQTNSQNNSVYVASSNFELETITNYTYLETKTGIAMTSKSDNSYGSNTYQMSSGTSYWTWTGYWRVLSTCTARVYYSWYDIASRTYYHGTKFGTYANVQVHGNHALHPVDSKDDDYCARKTFYTSGLHPTLTMYISTGVSTTSKSCTNYIVERSGSLTSTYPTNVSVSANFYSMSETTLNNYLSTT